MDSTCSIPTERHQLTQAQLDAHIRGDFDSLASVEHSSMPYMKEEAALVRVSGENGSGEGDRDRSRRRHRWAADPTG
jgi:hypothetical protein